MTTQSKNMGHFVQNLSHSIDYYVFLLQYGTKLHFFLKDVNQKSHLQVKYNQNHPNIKN
jgi:hypothetical protein